MFEYINPDHLGSLGEIDCGKHDDLNNLGIEVKGMGKPLTDYLKSDAKVMTF